MVGDTSPKRPTISQTKRRIAGTIQGANVFQFNLAILSAT